MPGKLIQPILHGSTFTCPRCDTVADQKWGSIAVAGVGGAAGEIQAAMCVCCQRVTIWEPTDGEVRMVYPYESPAPEPNADLPTDVLKDYQEAAAVVSLSPRAAAALLRLCVQRLCIYFGEPGKKIHEDIKSLAKKGKLNSTIELAMHTVRIAGNESVHPGELNLDDDPDLVQSLFEFVNLIAEVAITQPSRVREMLSRMPADKRKELEKGREPLALEPPVEAEAPADEAG